MLARQRKTGKSRQQITQTAHLPTVDAAENHSGNVQAPDMPPSNFQLFWIAALDEYKRQTGTELSTHPLAAALESCGSVDDIIAVFNEQCRAFDDFRKGSLMERLRPIVSIALSLSDTLSNGANLAFPPANIIFSGISVLLNATKNINESYDALIELLECVEYFLDRLKIYTQIPCNAGMRTIVVKTLADIITILALATNQVKRGRLSKYWKKLRGEKHIEDALKRMGKLTTEEARMAGSQSLESLSLVADDIELIMEAMNGIQDILAKIDHVITEGVASKAIIQNIASKQKRNEMRKWLSPPDPSINHNVARSSYHEGTAKWFIRSEIFEEWKMSGSLLWVHGKAGSGKSILCSTIIEDVECLCKTQQNTTLVYFYFDFRDTTKQNLRGLLSHLLTCLSVKVDSCADILFGLYSQYNDGSRQPTDAALAKCLKDMLLCLTKGELVTYIIIDALDECPNSPGIPSQREQVLEHVAHLVGMQTNTRICVTSRPESDIQKIFEPLPHRHVTLHVQCGLTEDISLYVHSIMHSDPLFKKWREEEKSLAIETLSRKADGMFRWVFCQLETLRQCLPATIRRTLRTLPKTLDETYQRILEGITEPKWEYAHRIFQCLTVSVRPLQVKELAEILAVDFDSETMPCLVEEWRSLNAKEDILSTCSTLVTVDAETEVVRFAHFSVQEYLVSRHLATEEKNSIRRFHVVEEHAHTVLAQACLSVLLQLNNPRDQICVENPPLAPYAAEHWVQHAQFKNVTSSLQGAMECLFHPHKPHFAAWIKIHDIDNPFLVGGWKPYKKVKPLYYAARCGFLTLAQHLVVTHAQDVNAQGGRYGTALKAASGRGHLAIVRFLVQNDADVNGQGGVYGSALQAASGRGHIEVVRFLIEHGAEVNARQCGTKGTALQAASGSGHLEVVRFLVQNGAKVNARSGNKWTALQAASGSGHLEVVRFLVQNGAEVNLDSQGHFYRTALQAASGGGRPDVVRFLVQNGADVNGQGGVYGTALQAASARGHPDVAQFLLENGAAANAHSSERDTASSEDSNDEQSDVDGARWQLVEHADPAKAHENGTTDPASTKDLSPLLVHLVDLSLFGLFLGIVAVLFS